MKELRLWPYLLCRITVGVSGDYRTPKLCLKRSLQYFVFKSEILGVPEFHNTHGAGDYVTNVNKNAHI